MLAGMTKVILIIRNVMLYYIKSITDTRPFVDMLESVTQDVFSHFQNIKIDTIIGLMLDSLL